MAKHKTPFAFWGVIGLFLLTTTFGLVWRFTPLHDHLDLLTLTKQGRALQHHAWAPLLIMVIFMIGGLIVFFHMVLLWTVVFIFDPWHAFLYCELGTLASAFTVYGLGRIARPEMVQRMAGSYLEKVSKALAKKGKLTLIILHWFPICPFSILNFISGATHISSEDFFVGTIVGCTPGLILLVLFGRQIMHVLRSHQWWNSIPLLFGVLALLGLGHGVRSYLRKKSVVPK